MLDKKVEAILRDSYVPDGPSVWDIPIAQVREGVVAMTAALPTPDVTIAGARDMTIPGPGGDLPVRVYTPEGRGPFPLLMFFHGSGFVMCNLDTHDHTARSLCRGSGALVVSVDYRLAPENKFPAAVEDVLAATRWWRANGAALNADVTRVAVAGDSAGGNLAAVCARLCQRAGEPLCAQLLIYPVLDYHTPGTPSYVSNDGNFGLTRERMEWFFHHYLTHPGEAVDERAAPLRATDFAGLPPAHIITAEYDVLRDEGRLYAERLAAEGVPVVYRDWPGMIHGFCGYAGILPQAEDALASCGSWLAEQFAKA